MTKPSSQFIPYSRYRLQLRAMPSARVLWLQQNNSSDLQAADFQNKLREQGLALEVTCIQYISSKQLADADIVLCNAFEQFEGVLETVAMRLRMESRVPLIMLTNGYSTEQLLVALKSGVDAIWSLNAPTEVLVARCKASLRRWIGAFS